MKISFDNQAFSVDLHQPIDISIPLRSGKENVNAFHIPSLTIEPFRIGSFIGNVNEGGSCNVNNIFFNPHGNGTHTECVGHISKEKITINQCLKKFFFMAQLITVTPEEKDGDKIITKEQISSAINNSLFPIRNSQYALHTTRYPIPNTQYPFLNALIIRTFPNESDKINKQYSGTNPPFLHHEAAKWICDTGIEHLLLDLPSVDKEDDGGNLLAHHHYWQYPQNTRLQATITELIYVPTSVPDGFYLLNLQIASFENDASPSKPVLYKLIEKE